LGETERNFQTGVLDEKFDGIDSSDIDIGQKVPLLVGVVEEKLDEYRKHRDYDELDRRLREYVFNMTHTTIPDADLQKCEEQLSTIVDYIGNLEPDKISERLYLDVLNLCFHINRGDLAREIIPIKFDETLKHHSYYLSSNNKHIGTRGLAVPLLMYCAWSGSYLESSQLVEKIVDDYKDIRDERILRLNMQVEKENVEYWLHDIFNNRLNEDIPLWHDSGNVPYMNDIREILDFIGMSPTIEQEEHLLNQFVQGFMENLDSANIETFLYTLWKSIGFYEHNNPNHYIVRIAMYKHLVEKMPPYERTLFKILSNRWGGILIDVQEGDGGEYGILEELKNIEDPDEKGHLMENLIYGMKVPEDPEVISDVLSLAKEIKDSVGNTSTFIDLSFSIAGVYITLGDKKGAINSLFDLTHTTLEELNNYERLIVLSRLARCFHNQIRDKNVTYQFIKTGYEIIINEKFSSNNRLDRILKWYDLRSMYKIIDSISEEDGAELISEDEWAKIKEETDPWKGFMMINFLIWEKRRLTETGKLYHEMGETFRGIDSGF
jgi:hypothetical protein